MNVKIFSRSFDLKLYEQSRALYADLGLECVRLTDTTADGYFYTMLRDTDCDIAINVDEDCFIANPTAVMELVDKVVKGGYANAGCQDGGGNAPRHGNPVVTNPFFNIFNLRLIREKFSIEAVLSYDYQQDKERLISEFPKEKLITRYDFNNKSYVEPYYPFFLWLAGNFKTLYLKSEMCHDGISTLLFDDNNHLLCAHSWMARFYSTPTFLAKLVNSNSSRQKARIDALIDEIHTLRGDIRPLLTKKDTLRYIADKIARWMFKIPQRIARWPRKIQKRLSGKGRWEL